ncbi:unnamed protein product [Lepidochelys olivacea]
MAPSASTNSSEPLGAAASDCLGYLTAQNHLAGNSTAGAHATQPDPQLLLIGAQQQEPDYVAIPVTVFYSLLFVFGLLANGLSLLTLLRSGRMRAGAGRFYLLSLATADVLMLLTVPGTRDCSFWQTGGADRRGPRALSNAVCKLCFMAQHHRQLDHRRLHRGALRGHLPPHVGHGRPAAVPHGLPAGPPELGAPHRGLREGVSLHPGLHLHPPGLRDAGARAVRHLQEHHRSAQCPLLPAPPGRHRHLPPPHLPPPQPDPPAAGGDGPDPPLLRGLLCTGPPAPREPASVGEEGPAPHGCCGGCVFLLQLPRHGVIPDARLHSQLEHQHPGALHLAEDLPLTASLVPQQCPGPPPLLHLLSLLPQRLPREPPPTPALDQ